MVSPSNLWQKRAVRVICGTPYLAHCKPLIIIVSLGILSLPSLYVLSALLLVKDNISSLYNLSDTHDFGTRLNKMNLVKLRCT